MKKVHMLKKAQSEFMKQRRRLAVYPIAIVQRGPDNFRQAPIRTAEQRT